MAKHPNLQRRGSNYCFRTSAHGILVRLSLNTGDYLIACEKAGILRRRLDEAVKALEARMDGLTAAQKGSIARAAARAMRDHLDVSRAKAELADPVKGRLDHLQDLHALDLVATDIAAHGMPPGFRSMTHFFERFYDEGWVPDSATLDIVYDIFSELGDLPGQIDADATDALRRLNIDVSPVNVAIAGRQILLGKLAGIRARIADARSPVNAIERALSMLDVDAAPTGPEPSFDPCYFAPPERPLMPAAAPIATAPAQPVDPFADISIKALAAAYFEAHPQCDVGQKGSIWTAKTRSQAETLVELADKFFGDRAIGSITEVELARFFRTLARLPVGHHKSDRHAPMSLEEIIAENKGGATLAIVTTNRHMRFLRSLLDWAFARMTHPPRIDWKSFIQRDRGAKIARDQREAFTAEELRTFFTGPIWFGAKSQVRRFDPGQLILHDAGYYGPLGLVYTGLRREEWFGLPTRDIIEIDGIWVIRLAADRQLKNANAVRDVPIADELIRLQLLKYVELRRARGDEYLFPDLGTTAADYGEQYARKFWRGHLRAGQVPANRVIHSTRHFVATELSEAGVSEKVVADLLGHGHEGETQGRYTKRASLARLHDAVNRIPVVTADLPIRPLRLR